MLCLLAIISGVIPYSTHVFAVIGPIQATTEEFINVISPSRISNNPLTVDPLVKVIISIPFFKFILISEVDFLGVIVLYIA